MTSGSRRRPLTNDRTELPYYRSRRLGGRSDEIVSRDVVDDRSEGLTFVEQQPDIAVGGHFLPFFRFNHVCSVTWS